MLELSKIKPQHVKNEVQLLENDLRFSFMKYFIVTNLDKCELQSNFYTVDRYLL